MSNLRQMTNGQSGRGCFCYGVPLPLSVSERRAQVDCFLDWRKLPEAAEHGRDLFDNHPQTESFALQ